MGINPAKFCYISMFVFPGESKVVVNLMKLTIVLPQDIIMNHNVYQSGIHFSVSQP